MVALLAAVALLVGADPPPAVDLEEGDPAPYAGTLIPLEVALRCASCVSVDLPACLASWRRDRETCAATANRLERERDAERLRGDKLNEALRGAGIKGRPRPWYEHPLLWGGVGLVVGAAVGVAVVLTL